MIDPLIVGELIRARLALRAIMSATTVDQVHYAAWLAHDAVTKATNLLQGQAAAVTDASSTNSGDGDETPSAVH
jgi:hypothetical protein